MAMSHEHARRWIRRAGPVLLVGLAWLPACGSTNESTGSSPHGTTPVNSSGSSGATVPRPPGSTTTTASRSAGSGTVVPGATPGTSTLAGADTSPKERAPETGAATTHLRAVRVARQDGFDRVVFEFDGAVPGYKIRYVDPPVLEDPSGKPVTVSGSGLLRATFASASGVELGAGGVQTFYTGPSRVTGDARAVKEVVSTGDFEAVLSWVIGMDQRHPNKVTTLPAPSRVIVDIATP